MRRHFLALAVLATTAAASSALAADVPAVTAADRVLGRADAPVTVIEYASFTCSHCAAFHNDVLPAFKARFIDSGQVRLVYRNLPTAPVNVAAAASAVAVCAAPDRFFDVADAFMKGQAGLSTTGAKPWFDAGVAASGRTRAQIDACVARPEIKTFLEAEVAAGAATGITGTPAFFVNGRLVRDRSLGGLEVAIRAAEGG